MISLDRRNSSRVGERVALATLLLASGGCIGSLAAGTLYYSSVSQHDGEWRTAIPGTSFEIDTKSGWGLYGMADPTPSIETGDVEGLQVALYHQIGSRGYLVFNFLLMTNDGHGRPRMRLLFGDPK